MPLREGKRIEGDDFLPGVLPSLFVRSCDSDVLYGLTRCQWQLFECSTLESQIIVFGQFSLGIFPSPAFPI